VAVAASTPGPGTIKKEWVSKMADDAIMFAEANPVPEIWPWEAKEAGVKIFGTGRGLSEDYVIPTMEDWEVFPREAVAVGMKAIEQGVARLKLSEEELYEKALSMIKESRDKLHCLMENGLIKKPPEIKE